MIGKPRSMTHFAVFAADERGRLSIVSLCVGGRYFRRVGRDCVRARPSLRLTRCERTER
jgi:hypothetical protein